MVSNEKELVTHMLTNPTRSGQHRIGLLMTFFLLVSVLVTVSTAPASGTVPGANGKIAYERLGAIWSMDADGSNQVQLTSTMALATYHEPAWSPDGTRIAYRRNPTFLGSDDIGVMNANGTGFVNLTNTPGVDEFDPTWSPDGTKIAYRRGGAIWSMDADGSNQVQLTSTMALGTHNEPAWSPDGTKIAYRWNPAIMGSDDISVMNANGTRAVNLTNTPGVDEFGPTWSPDGTRIAYQKGGDIWTMTSVGSKQAAATTTLFDKEYEPAWSPDGTKIAIRYEPAFGSFDDIFVMNPDGTGMVNLTSTAGVDESDPTWQPVNRPPVAVDDPHATPHDTTVTVAAPGVLGNDSDADGDTLTVANPAGVTVTNGTVAVAADGSFTYTPNTGFIGTETFTYKATDGDDTSNTATVTIAVAAPGVPTFLDDTVGLVSPLTGEWYLRNSVGTVTTFYYGNPGDVPFMGDWNCNGTDTPGLFRTSDAYAYLRDSNTQGIADIRFFFGNPSDMPIAGDFNGDGCDTLSIYRPSEARFYIMNELGEDEGGLGAADYSFLFGDAGDKPVVGDWDGDGIDEIGLHRESTGFFYYRNTLTTGTADGQFYFGDPGDRFVAGDWGIIDGRDTPALFRPSSSVFYFRHTLTEGIADAQFTWTGAGTTWLPIAGDFDLG